MSEISLLARKKRHKRIKKKIFGTAEVPRMGVFCSLKNMYVQFIDDINSKCLLGCGTLQKQFLELYKTEKGSGKDNNKSNKNSAAILGKISAEAALKKGIKKVVFDRSGYKYHGRIQALADSARKAGLSF